MKIADPAKFDAPSSVYDTPCYTITDGVIEDPASVRDETSREFRRFWETSLDQIPLVVKKAYEKIEEARWASLSGPVYTRRTTSA